MNEKHIEIEVNIRVRDPKKGTVKTIHGTKARIVGAVGTAFENVPGYLSPAERERLAGDLVTEGKRLARECVEK